MPIDGQAFLADLKILENDILGHVKSAVERAVDETIKHAKATTLFTDRTGFLRRSIVGWTLDNVGEASAMASYAHYINAGTKPHIIRGNPFLTFVWNGEKMSFRSVQHPGTAPREFMDLARDWGEAVFRQNTSVMIWDDIYKFNAR
jgi:hypothetical protein